MRPSLLVILATLVVLLIPGTAQAAAGTRDGSLVVLTGDAVVGPGDIVDSVVVFDGAVRVEGTVRDSVVAFNGPVTIIGDVDGDVVVFDGALVVQTGAHIAGDVFADRRMVAPGARIDGTTSSTARFAVAAGWAAVAIGVAVWIAIAVSILLLGLLLLWFAPRAADAVLMAGKTAVGPSIGWGAAAFFGLPVLGVIAIATLVGLPLGIGILLALALIFAIGHVTGAWVLGRLIVKKGSRFGAFALGWAILAVVGLIPGVGGLTWFAATVYGLGVICVAAFRARRAPTNTELAPEVPATPVQV